MVGSLISRDEHGNDRDLAVITWNNFHLSVIDARSLLLDLVGQEYLLCSVLFIFNMCSMAALWQKL